MTSDRFSELVDRLSPRPCAVCEQRAQDHRDFVHFVLSVFCALFGFVLLVTGGAMMLLGVCIALAAFAPGGPPLIAAPFGGALAIAGCALVAAFDWLERRIDLRRLAL